MPQLPVQSAHAIANLIASPPPGPRADAGNAASDPAKSFSGMLKKEMTRSEQSANESREAAATSGQKAQETGDTEEASHSQEAASADTAIQDPVASTTEIAVDPAVTELIAVLTASGQPTSSTGENPDVVVDAAQNAGDPTALLPGPGAPMAEAGNLLPVPTVVPAMPAQAATQATVAAVPQPEAGPTLAETSRLPVQAAETARFSHSTAPDAANPAGRPLPEQAVAGDGRTVEHGTSRHSPQDFAALIERASAEHGVQPAAAQAGMARELAHSYRIEAPAGQPARWAQEIGDRVAWMVTSREQRAELVLNPPQLGRIEVTLAVNGDQANAWFSSPNSTVRELLETSLPRLREVMAEAGIQLGQAQVGADTPGFASRGEEQRQDSGSGIQNRTEESGYVRLPAAGAAIAAGRGLVDVFA